LRPVTILPALASVLLMDRDISPEGAAVTADCT